MNDSSTMALPIKHLVTLLPVAWLAGCAYLPPSEMPVDEVEQTPATCELLQKHSALRVAIQNARGQWQLEPAVALALLEPPLGAGQKRHVLPYGNAWDEYRIAVANWSARTDDIADAVDFLGWGAQRNREMLKLEGPQAKALYLAYRLGPGAYSQGVHEGIWIEKEAEAVAARAVVFANDLQHCPDLVQMDRWEWQRLWGWW